MFFQKRAARWPAFLACLGILTFAGCYTAPKQQDQLKHGYSFWPAAPDEPRVQFLTSFNQATDVQPELSKFDQMVYGSENRVTYPINKPYGVRMWDGRIYVCDVRAKGITVLDLRKKQARIMGAAGQFQLTKAVDLAIAPDGTKYVLDGAQSNIVVFSPDERFVEQFHLPDTSPVGIAISGGVLYVTDMKSATVKVIDRTSGKILRSIGERGGEDGQFIGPLAICVDKAGNIYVSDTIKARVQKFSPDGKLLMAFGQPGNHPGDFVRPKHLGVTADGYLHVVDAAFNNVQVFDPEGKFVGYYGAPGQFAGSMDLPAGLDIHEGELDLFATYLHPAFEADRLVVVANQFGAQKIAVYALGHLKPGKTAADVSGGRTDVTVGLASPTTAPATAPAGMGKP